MSDPLKKKKKRYCSGKSQDFNEIAWAGELDGLPELAMDPEVNFNWKDEGGRSAFYCACEYGHVDVVRFMLDFQDPHGRKIDFNFIDRQGWTPLCIACCHGHVGVVEMLLKDQRINVNSVNLEGSSDSPLLVAAQWGQLLVVMRLLGSSRKINVHLRDKKQNLTAAEIARKKEEKTQMAKIIEAYGRAPQSTRARLEVSLRESDRCKKFLTSSFFTLISN